MFNIINKTNNKQLNDL